MSWYESTASSSISLCRSLLAANPAKLAQVDSILKAHNLEALLRTETVVPGMSSIEEAQVELKWLKTFLQNVHDRNERLGLLFQRKHPSSAVLNGGKNSLDRKNSMDSNLAEQVAATSPQKRRIGRPATGSRTPISHSLYPVVANGSARKLRPRGYNRTHQPEALGQAEFSTTAQHNNKASVEKAPSTSHRRLRSAESGYKDIWNQESKRRKTEATKKTPYADIPVSTNVGRSSPRLRLSLRELGVQFAPQAQLGPAAVPELEKWCVCRGPSYGEMVACDNERCPIEWYHLNCAKLKSLPRSTWYCPKCKPQMDRAARSGRRRKRV